MVHSPLFGSCQRIYNSDKDLDWLKRAVVKGAIRPDEYKEICGEDYTAPTGGTT